MPLVVCQIHALASAATLGILAFFLACAAVVFVGVRVRALLVAAGGVSACFINEAYFVVFLVARLSCIIFVVFCKEATQPFGREQRFLFLNEKLFWVSV
jgi:hypothetical protein